MNEARQGQVNRVKIVEKEREGLEGEKMAAEAYLHKDAERLGTQSKIFQRFMSDGQVGTAGLHCCAWLCLPHAKMLVRKYAKMLVRRYAMMLVSRHAKMLMPRCATMLMPKYAKQDLAAIHV